MKNFLLAVCCIFFTSFTIAQTNISGIINDYAAVTNVVLNACNKNDLTVDNASAFNAGDTILIIQMQGATIDLTNTANFGDIIDEGSAGKLEKNVIKSIAGNIISLNNSLINTYDVAGKVQIVSRPYYNGNVNVNAVLTAANWDGNKGGVLAFETNGILTLNADIDIVGKGFRGGGVIANGTGGESCDFFGAVINGCVGVDYFYNNTSSFAVDKGEGIAIFSNTHKRGKGKNANGGGGGGIEAGGGGGGANMGNGGVGGGCNEISCSSGLGCNCANVSIVAGVAGESISFNAGLMYLGGGSGAGNNGNSSQYYGTQHSLGLNGGGIAIIEASSIVGNNNSINVSGVAGVDLSSSGIGTMGTSGGGGGGSIFVNATTFTNLNLIAEGGRGNDSRKTSGSTNATGGSGGGGGGGLVAFGTPIIPAGVTISVTGGIAGNCYDREGDLRPIPFKGTNGLTGTQIANFSVNEGAAIVINPGTLVSLVDLCVGNDFVFTPNPDTGYLYQWQIDSFGGVWEDLLPGNSTFTNTTTSQLTLIDVFERIEEFDFRLMTFNTCGDTVFSNVGAVNVDPVPIINLDPVNTSTCLGGDALFFGEVSDATTLQWQRLSGGWQNLTDNANYSGTDTDSLTISNVDATFNNSFYRLQATNSCGSDFSTIAILSLASQPIIIDAQSDDLQVCVGEDSLLYYTSSSTIDTIQWQINMGGGFVNLVNNGDYQGVNNDTLQLIGIAASDDGDIFRALLSNRCGDLDTVDNILLNVAPAPSVSLTDTQFLCEGSGVFISIPPGGVQGSNITYQWQVDSSGIWENLTDANGYSNTTGSFLGLDQSIVIPSLSSDFYRVVINTDCGQATSNPIILLVSANPEIVLQAENDTVCLGDDASFSVTANGASSFQWQSNASGTFQDLVNNATFSGVNTDSLIISNSTAIEAAADYRVVLAANPPCTDVISDTVNIILPASPAVITGQSNSFSICEGLDTFLFVTTTFPADSYQWFVNPGSPTNLTESAPYSGTQTDTLFISPADFTQDGLEFVVSVEDFCGVAVQTLPVEISITPGLTLVNSPDSIEVCLGEDVEFVLEASGSNVVYQWQEFDGISWSNIMNAGNYSGATTDTLAIANVQNGINGDLYRALINDDCGVADTTLAAELFIKPVINILTQSPDISICNGEDTLLYFISNLLAETIQWQIFDGANFIDLNNDINYSGVTTDSLDLTDIPDSFDENIYRAYALDSCGFGDTTVFINLTVIENVMIDAQPTSKIVCEGDSTGFGVRTSGNPSTYQWQLFQGSFFIDLTDDANYSGTQSDTLIIVNVSVGFDGNQYQLVITDTCNTATTISVNLTVNPNVTITEDRTICANDSLTLSDGSSVNTTGLYQDTISNGALNGCDSIITYDLTVNPLSFSNATTILCFGDSLELSNGSFIYTTGMYSDTIVGGADNSCDSIHTIDLTILPLATSNLDPTLCFGDSFELSDGSFVNTTGIYNDTLLAATPNGCDSIVVIDLTISPLITENVSETICSNDSLVLSDGTSLNTTGIYNDTLTNAAASGCDSIVVYDLTVNPVASGANAQSICAGESYTLPSGLSADTTGTYIDTLTAQAENGCDSIVTTNLTVLPVPSTSLLDSFCAGSNYVLPSGTIVTNGGIYNDTLSNAANNGCDSIVVVDLFENSSPAVSNDTVILCFGDSLQLSDGSFEDATGTYNDTIASGSANGCDSIHTIDLTILPLATSNLDPTLCFGDSFELSDGSFVNATGIYTDTLLAATPNGCDSFVLIDLTILAPINSLITPTLCFGDSFELSDGSFVNTTSNYLDTIVNGSNSGCDSIVTIDLTVLPLNTTNQFRTICSNDSLVLSDGTVVNTTGIYNDTLFAVTANGCDSIIVYDLTVNPVANGSNTQTICAGDTFVRPGGGSETISGIYVDTLIGQAANGCDSIVTSNLTVLPLGTSTVNDNFCSGGTYTLATGFVVDSSGTYQDTIPNGSSNNCDSIITYNLTEDALPVAVIINDTICFNENFTLPNGTQVNTAGIYTDTLSANDGCDSLVQFDLFVRPANSILDQSQNLLLCAGESAVFYVESQQTNVIYEWTNNGVPMINSNNDTMTLPNISAGNSGSIFQVQIFGVCDTLFGNAVLLTVRPNAAITLNPVDVEVCEGDAATFTITTDIPVLSFEWFENGAPIANSNAATFTIPATILAQNGNQYTCTITDSCNVQTSSTIGNLTVNPNLQLGFQSSSQTACVNTDVLFFVTATAGSNISYQWTLNGSNIAGETNDSLSLTNVDALLNNNTYSCVVTSDCGTITSNEVVLTVLSETILLSQSDDFTQCAGFSFDLLVEATNVQVYQWQIDQGLGFVNLIDGDLNGTTTQVTGATTANLTISNYEASISGSIFQVILTNSCAVAPIYTPITITITSPVEITDPVEDVYSCIRELEPITLPYVTSNGSWSNGDFGPTFIPTETGVYTVDYIDENNCPNSDEIYVELEDCVASCYVTAPTGFSPNGSQANDVFRAIYGCDLSFFELVVYNRWGELVFFTNDPNAFWDGEYQGKSADIGVYTWYIQYQKEGADSKEAVKGNVTLIR